MSDALTLQKPKTVALPAKEAINISTAQQFKMENAGQLSITMTSDATLCGKQAPLIQAIIYNSGPYNPDSSAPASEEDLVRYSLINIHQGAVISVMAGSLVYAFLTDDVPSDNEGQVTVTFTPV